MISTGSVMLPQFKVATGLWTITVFSGTYIWDTRTLLIHSGVIVLAGSGTEVLSGSTITFDMNSRLIADTISADTIIDTYETYIYWEKRLQPDVKVLLNDFLTKNASGSTIPVAPTNTNYFNKYVRGLLSILMSQPEYVLLSWYDLPTTVSTTEQRFLDNVTGKLFFVELYGWNDYLTSIIPKDEYSTYLDYRSNQSGSIAITGTGLVDIGDFYMNSALAFSSWGWAGFKSLYDQWYLKIFNRVWAYRHSNDHDAAAKQISSYDNTTALSAEWAFGHMVKEEFESSHTISLGSKLPNIYRAGRFVNLGWSVILVNPLDQSGQLKAHMDAMQNITLSRSYPSNTRNLFKDAGRISEIAKMSVAQWGPSGANWDMNNVFRFAKVLMNNNVGRSFYMGGFGWYDTHGDQFNWLNRNLRFVSTAVTNFFNEVKDTQDVTIVIFSEFGRTNKTNWDLGTDHGDGGGMYVLTSNAALRTKLQAGTYGNMSIKNAKYNSLGVGIDYRSVYGSIFNSIYGLNETNYFGTPISLMNDISTTPNDISLLSYSYRASGQTPLLDVEVTVSGNNFDPGKSWYTRLLAGTGLLNQRSTRLNEKVTAEWYRYNFQINPNNQPYFSIESFSNQYALNWFSWTLTWSSRPMILGNAVRTISQTGTSILPLFGNTAAPSMLSGSGIILESTGSNIVSIPSNNQIRIFFASGITNVTSLTYTSGSTTWRGGFTLAEKIDKDLFIPTSAIIVPDNSSLQTSNITHLFKIGADLRWVWMNLNQNVWIEFSWLIASGSYRALSSQDGITWNDVESAGRLYTSSSTGSILVNTDHFSYFALLSMANVVVTPPSCTISINPNSVLNGSGTILTWNMLNSLTGTLNPGNTLLGTSGSMIITPPSNATTPYTLVVANSAWTNSCTASVTASAVVVPPVTPPSCTISINPNSVLNGSGTILTWNMLNSLTGTLNPGNTLLGTSGSMIITPPSNATTPYTLVVANSAWTNSCTASVTASAVVVPPVTPPSSGWWGAVTGPGGWGGGWSSSIARILDTCLGGDFSWNNYDGVCDSIARPVWQPVVNNVTNNIESLVISGLISKLISDLEKETWDTLSDNQLQRTYAISLGIWREISNKQDMNLVSAWQLVNSLKDLRNKSVTVKTKKSLDIITGILDQFIIAWQLENTENNALDTSENITLNSLDLDTSENRPSNGTVKYVQAERSVTFRKTDYVWLYNVLDYLNRNTQVTLISEGMNWWTRVLYNGLEWYIKTAYLRDANDSDIVRNGGTVSDYHPQWHINVKQSAYVRYSPDLNARISFVVYRDNTVRIIDSISGWYEIVSNNGSRGYIRKELVNTMDTTL
jgi:uncharacterized protein (DUF1501 family)